MNQNMPDQHLEVLRKETFLKAVENSVGSRLFNSLYIKDQRDGKANDILEDGVYSCAFFVSSLLYLAGTLDKLHATVRGLRDAFEKNDHWQNVSADSMEPGDVIFWEKIKFDDGTENAHVGFAIDEREAVSTDYRQRVIVRHPIFSARTIDGVYRYSW